MTPEEIISLREKMGLSIREFAKKAGVAHMTVWRWEQGRNRPKGLQLEKLERLAKRYG